MKSAGYEIPVFSCLRFFFFSLFFFLAIWLSSTSGRDQAGRGHDRPGGRASRTGGCLFQGPPRMMGFIPCHCPKEKMKAGSSQHVWNQEGSIFSSSYATILGSVPGQFDHHRGSVDEGLTRFGRRLRS